MMAMMLLQVIKDSYEYHGLNDLFFFCITALAVTLVSILQCCKEQKWGGGLLHVDMFAHNKSGIAYQDGNRRSETVVNGSCASSSRSCGARSLGRSK
jgi:hypothetical protein